MNISTRNLFVFLFILTVFSWSAGCFRSGPQAPEGMPKLVPIKVLLTQEGAPLAGASVTLYPDPPTEWSAGGTSDEQGQLEVRTAGQFNGAAAGTYKVTVSKIEQEPLDFSGDPQQDQDAYEKAIAKQKSYHLVDPKFSNMDSTPLTITVEAGKPLDPIELGKPVRTLLK